MESEISPFQLWNTGWVIFLSGASIFTPEKWRERERSKEDTGVSEIMGRTVVEMGRSGAELLVFKLWLCHLPAVWLWAKLLALSVPWFPTVKWEWKKVRRFAIAGSCGCISPCGAWHFLSTKRLTIINICKRSWTMSGTDHETGSLHIYLERFKGDWEMLLIPAQETERRAVYLTYLTYMLSTSWEMLGWMSYKL